MALLSENNRNKTFDYADVFLPSSALVGPRLGAHSVQRPCGNTRNPDSGIATRTVRTHKKAIKIENPVAGCGFTTGNRARRFVAKGRAQWVEPGVSIRFVSSDRRHQAAEQSVAATRRGYDLAACTGMARITELANLPMVAPAVLLGLGRRKGASRHTFLAVQGF